MLQVDESKFSQAERLGIAWCRLNGGEWDTFLGTQPKDIDFIEVMQAIQLIIGEANCIRCWWIYILEKTEEEWLRWFTVDRFTESDQSIQ